MEYEKIAEMDFEKRDFWKVVFCMDCALEFAPACHRFKILKAGCFAMLGQYPEAQLVASDILRMDSTNADALHVQCLCFHLCKPHPCAPEECQDEPAKILTTPQSI